MLWGRGTLDNDTDRWNLLVPSAHFARITQQINASMPWADRFTLSRQIASFLAIGEGETKSMSFLLPIIGRGGDRQ